MVSPARRVRNKLIEENGEARAITLRIFCQECNKSFAVKNAFNTISRQHLVKTFYRFFSRAFVLS
jgi:hypothetical protein